MATPNQDVQMVIITGMSGAGKTVAVQSFEDLGFFCVDNLPPTLLPKLMELVKESGNKMNKIALVMDMRGREFFDTLIDAIDGMSEVSWITPQILFLDASDQVLVSRYKETRRSHPLAKSGLPLEGIRLEREILDELKGRAQHIIDTSELTPRMLREKIINGFSQDKQPVFTVNVISFGFKYGIPIDADLVFDVRFLPNPHYIDSLRPKTGLDEEVSSYVLKQPETQKFLEKLIDLLTFMLPQYKREGKSQLVIAIGCTGGQHRSVTLAEYIGKHFENGYFVGRGHRDIEKRKGKR
ncbi:putative P-loop-containing kinase [Schinkia azotoformans MEV2011]|uniref:GlmZ(SRNA)-inactivating NTPase n=2 Tax=Schinkia azotoformans TaxID=1454 RepID=K6D5E7_SCHAZ|nr:RNase adapter RapZ [Schinkia azotoformans]EKN67737.1 glmZ(sRNA)-inactivating NTPase [Schinkia azotoformans LMG 9581]KEF40260.1 putative P-loop-containing kinase [Schinkia azotoformans MEV2011]MEC1637493.1 RNase adapter RapZ [Schinkia azotoformans]MEC1696432.1 RNase adapter RapZ [Schinkia azotoformans]MEC1715181.1 RNase adapter RapZ [Schinkia azotoformans]